MSDIKKCQYCARSVLAEFGEVEVKRYRHSGRMMTSTRFCCTPCGEKKRQRNAEIELRKQHESGRL